MGARVTVSVLSPLCSIWYGGESHSVCSVTSVLASDQRSHWWCCHITFLLECDTKVRVESWSVIPVISLCGVTVFAICVCVDVGSWWPD